MRIRTGLVLTAAAAWTAAGPAAKLPENYEIVRLTDYRVFYENDLEYDNGARQDCYARVHTNGAFFCTTNSSAYYHQGATAAGLFHGGIYNPADGARRSWYSGSNNVYFAASRTPGSLPGDAAAVLANIYDSVAVTTNKHYMASTIYNPGNPSIGNPLYDQAEAVGARWVHNPDWVPQSLAFFDGYLKDSKHGVKRIEVAFGTTAAPVILDDRRTFIEAATGDALVTDPVADQQAAYRAALVIELVDDAFLTNDTSGGIMSSFEAYRYQPAAGGGYERIDSFGLAYWLDGAAQTVGNRRSFLSHTRIYDGRETKYMNLVDVDLARLAECLDAANVMATGTRPDLQSASGDEFDGLVHFAVPQSLAPAGEQLAVRLYNGADLTEIATNAGLSPSEGLSFVANAPIYLKGDFNKTNAIPALVAGDAVDMLSNAFSDATYASSTGNGPNATASNTEYRAVFIAGNVPTTHNVYSGGTENYFRMIENWGSKTVTFRGCQLNLFASATATGPWDKSTTTAVNAGHYGAPIRNWDWDTRYDWTSGEPIQPPGMPFGVRAVPALVGGSGPAGLSNADGGSPLLLWLNADDYLTGKGTAATWPDASGQAFTVEAVGTPTASASAIAGHAAVEFNGTDQWFQITEGVEDLTDGFGLFVVAESTAAAGIRPLVEFGNGPSSDTLAVSIDAAAGQISVESWIGDDAPPATTPGTVGTGFELQSIVHVQTEGAGVAGSLELRRNGTSTGGGTIPTPVNVARSLCYVGNGSAGSPFAGRIAELVLFAKGPGAARTRILENSLAAKYGLAIAGDVYAGETPWSEDVAGVGAESDGRHESAQSAGLRIACDLSSSAAGTYVIFGHDGGDAVAKGASELPSPVLARWGKTWFVDATNASTEIVDVEFDFAAEGLATAPDSGGDYRLIGRAGTSGPFALLAPGSGAVAGSSVLFASIPVSDLDGMAVTLGAVAGPLPVELGAWSVE